MTDDEDVSKQEFDAAEEWLDINGTYGLAVRLRQTNNSAAWKDAAQRLGEQLATVGPEGYRDFGPEQWLEWALSTVQDRVLVPTEPTDALLASMAMRYRHDFGLMHADEQQFYMRQMRQLHEEVVLRGFYSPAVTERYTALLKGDE